MYSKKTKKINFFIDFIKSLAILPSQPDETVVACLAACHWLLLIVLRRYSSVVEHVIGNDGVASPILASGTIR